jgi:hypothetical protein
MYAPIQSDRDFIFPVGTQPMFVFFLSVETIPTRKF